jgi:glutathione S-transferase
MPYEIIGTIRSPFVRICRMLMIQNGIECDFRVLNFVEDSADAAALDRETPINKVPVLIDGDKKIFDSRVIVGYLTRKHGLRSLSIDEENFVSAIYSCLDTGVTLFLMKRDGFDVNGPSFFLSRQKVRIPKGLDYVRAWARGLNASIPDHWNYASMSLYSFLYWAQARGIHDVASDPDFSAFLDRFKEAPGVSETGF